VRPANLARRPFRNERVPNILFAIATLVVLAVTVRHAFLIRAVLPRRTSALHDEVQQLEKTSADLRAEQASLRTVNPDPKALARWLVVKDLVDRRAFSWTQLFARLEARLPEGARLVAIAPSVKQGEITLDVQAVVRSPEVGWQFIRSLEEGGEFDSVFPLSEGESGEFHYTMRYRPNAATVADASAATSSPDTTTPEAVPGETTLSGSGSTAAMAKPVAPTALEGGTLTANNPARGAAVGRPGLSAAPPAAVAPPVTVAPVPAGEPAALAPPQVPLTPSGVNPRSRRGRRAEAPA